MVKVICVVCGKEFESIKSTKKYCSDNCRNEARRIKYAEQQVLKEKKPPKQMGEKQCLICGKVFRPKTPAANQRQCCYDCMPEGVQLKRGDFLAKLKQSRGGKCERCGYDKCIQALEFHHIDPSQKDFTISNDHFKLKEAVEESKKCIIICSNCHKELHAGLWKLEDLKEKEEVESYEADN